MKTTIPLAVVLALICLAPHAWSAKDRDEPRLTPDIKTEARLAYNRGLRLEKDGKF